MSKQGKSLDAALFFQSAVGTRLPLQPTAAVRSENLSWTDYFAAWVSFSDDFSWQSWKQPEAPGLSVGTPGLLGPWCDRCHLPSQHIPVWPVWIIRWDQQGEGGDESSQAWPILVSPIHTVGECPWQTHFAEIASQIIWLWLFSGVTRTKMPIISFSGGCTQHGQGQGEAGKNTSVKH